MEIILGVVSSILVEMYKRLESKYGKKTTSRMIHLVLFGLALVWTILIQQQIISWETLESFIKLLGIAVGTYELILKNIYKLFGLN